MNEMRGKRERKYEISGEERTWKHQETIADFFYWLNLLVESTYFCTAKVRVMFLQSNSSDFKLYPKRNMSSFLAFLLTEPFC